jgi:hypothetical protein
MRRGREGVDDNRRLLSLELVDGSILRLAGPFGYPYPRPTTASPARFPGSRAQRPRQTPLGGGAAEPRERRLPTTPTPYSLSLPVSANLSTLTHSVTSVPCTAYWRTMRLPSTVSLNFAAASVASAIFRPARLNGGVSGFESFICVLHSGPFVRLCVSITPPDEVFGPTPGIHRSETAYAPELLLPPD